MFEALEAIMNGIQFKGPDSVLSHATRSVLLYDTLLATAGRLQEECAKAAQPDDRHRLKILSEGFEAAARLTQGLRNVGMA